MDKLDKLGGAETRQRRAAARPGTWAERVKRQKRQSRWQVAEKDDRNHPGLAPGQSTDWAGPARTEDGSHLAAWCLRWTREREGRKQEQKQALGAKELALWAQEEVPPPSQDRPRVLQGRGAWKLATQAAPHPTGMDVLSLQGTPGKVTKGEQCSAKTFFRQSSDSENRRKR